MYKRFCDKCGIEVKDAECECLSFERRYDLCKRCARDTREFLTPDKPLKVKTVSKGQAVLTCQNCKKAMQKGYFVQQNGKSIRVCDDCYNEIVKF